jgi:sugar (pentulose or hexulose) kinase
VRAASPSSAALFVGVDVGTSGCRAAVVAADGIPVAHAAVALPRPERRGCAVTQAPDLWWDALLRVLREVARAVECERVQALAVDATSGTLVPCDRAGIPHGPAMMYDDARGLSEARAIAAAAPPESAAHGPSSALAKLLWWRARHPRSELLALHQADWLSGRLSGRFGVSDWNNALKLGFDPVSLAWPPWLEALGVDARWLPQVLPPGSDLGALSAAAAAASGLPRHVRVVCGTTDGVAGVLAAGAHRPGEGVSALGSTLILKLCSDAPVFAPAYGVYSHRIGDLWLAGGASNAGAAVLERYFSADDLEAMTPRLRPDRPTGLDYYPLPAPGERFPVCDPRLAPRLDPRPARSEDFLQGLLEGLSAIEAQGYRRLQALGAPRLASVRTLGGGARNAAWRAMRERALSVPLLPADAEDPAVGTARLAAGWARA